MEIFRKRSLVVEQIQNPLLRSVAVDIYGRFKQTYYRELEDRKVAYSVLEAAIDTVDSLRINSRVFLRNVVNITQLSARDLTEPMYERDFNNRQEYERTLAAELLEMHLKKHDPWLARADAVRCALYPDEDEWPNLEKYGKNIPRVTCTFA